MKLCDAHFQKLKTALIERGLEKYFSKSGEEAAQAVVENKSDPLTSSVLAIYANSLEVAGLTLLTLQEDGTEWCPVCFFQQKCTCGAEDCKPRWERWIDHAANDELERFAGKSSG